MRLSCAHWVWPVVSVCDRSPGLAKRSEFHVEGPGAPILVGDVPDFLGNSGGGDEEVVRRVRPPLARPLQVDDRVDHHIGDVYPFWAEFGAYCFESSVELRFFDDIAGIRAR